MRIGVLAVQGAFAEHIEMLEDLGANPFSIRKKTDLFQPFDGLVIPGGESTVIGKLVRELGFHDILKKQIEDGLPVFGTCAGLLMLAEDICNDSRGHLRTMNIKARRNAYGRQLGSYKTERNFEGIGEVPMVFIRAPYIEEVGAGVEVLAEVGGKIVAAKQGNQLVTAFHPELTGDERIHGYFIEMIEKVFPSKKRS